MSLTLALLAASLTSAAPEPESSAATATPQIPPATAEPESPPAAAPAKQPPQPRVVRDAKGDSYRLELQARPPDQSDEEEAERLFEEGKRAYKSGRYREAIRKLELAYAADPSDGTVYSLGNAHREIYEAEADATHYNLAVLRYDTYLELTGTEGFYFNATRTNLNRLAALRAGETPPTRIVVSADAPEAWVKIDDGDPRPLGLGTSVEPGSHVVEVGAPRHQSQRRRYTVEEGQRLAVSVRLTPLPGQLRISGPRKATLTIDGTAYAELPVSERIKLPPGNHLVAVTRRGRVPYARDVVVHADERLDLDAATRRSTQRVLSVTLLGVGGAGLVGGAVTMGLALGAQRRAKAMDDARKASSASPDDYADYTTLVQRRDRLRTAAVASGAVGGALALTGLVLFLVERTSTQPLVIDRQRTAKRGRRVVKAVPEVGPSYAGATTLFAF